MFTGLVEQIGSIVEISPTTEYEGYSFVIDQASTILSDCSIGDSIAVNGCCLTVTQFDPTLGTFKVGLSNETLARTDLGQSPLATSNPLTPVTGELVLGSRVNLERAMSGHGRFGGHFVQVRLLSIVTPSHPSIGSHRYHRHDPLHRSRRRLAKTTLCPSARVSYFSYSQGLCSSRWHFPHSHYRRTTPFYPLSDQGSHPRQARSLWGHARRSYSRTHDSRDEAGRSVG